MVTLPEFENERMAIVSEQNDNQVMMLEHMQRLSERVDVLERRHKARLEELFTVSKEQAIDDDNDEEKVPIIGTSAAMVQPSCSWSLYCLDCNFNWY